MNQFQKQEHGWNSGSIPRVIEKTHREVGKHGVVEIPVVELRGAEPGPRIVILAGMHGAEYAGVLASYALVEELKRKPVHGVLKVLPIISTESFFRRSEQLSPIDERELHYVWPGEMELSHSHHLIDAVFRIAGDADAVIDLHGGGFVQDLTPHVNVPSLGTKDKLWNDSLDLARCFDVPFICERAVSETPLALPRALLEAGIPNVWTEIGGRGSIAESDINLQKSGLFNVLRSMGFLLGDARLFETPLLGPRHWSLIAEVGGLWHPQVQAGDHVKKDQELGWIVDLFGRLKQVYVAPADSVVKYICVSPAIDTSWTPHGYQWHQWLVQLVEA